MGYKIPTSTCRRELPDAARNIWELGVAKEGCSYIDVYHLPPDSIDEHNIKPQPSVLDATIMSLGLCTYTGFLCGELLSSSLVLEHSLFVVLDACLWMLPVPIVCLLC